MKSKGFVLIPLIILLAIAGVAFVMLRQDNLEPNETTAPNRLTQDHEFVNSKYNYRVTYSDLYEISTSNPEISDTVTFREKNDTTPAESGIQIKVIESTSPLLDACGTPILENEGILCDKATLTIYPMLDNVIPWEAYLEDTVSVVPSGDVSASTNKDGKLYLIINYGYEDAAVQTFTSNFRFVD